MDELFTTFTTALQGMPALALGAAFLWGVLSILLSPCHLAGIPLVVGYINGQGKVGTRRALSISSVFALGILASIALVGGVTVALGRMAGDLGGLGNYAVAAVFIVMGLHFLEIIPLPSTGFALRQVRRRGLLTALLLGGLFGAALGPCTFAFMAPLLGMVFREAGTSLSFGLLLLGLFAVGHTAVIVAAGTSAERVQRFLNWSEGSRGPRLVRYASGVLLLVAALYFVYGAR